MTKAKVCALLLLTVLASALLLVPIAALGCPTSTTTTEDGGAYTRTEVRSLSIVATGSKACPGIRCPCEGTPVKATYQFTETWTKTKSHSPVTIGAVLEGLFKFLKFNLTGQPNPKTDTHTATESKTMEASATCGQIAEIAAGTVTVIEQESRSGEGESGTKNENDSDAIVATNVRYQNQTWDPCTGVMTPTQGLGCP